MSRVSLLEEKDHPELKDPIAKIRGERGGRLLNIFQMLLHSPSLAMAWLEQVSAVRWKTQLSGQIRELVILRVGIINRVDYIFNAHVPAYTHKEGLSLAQCNAIVVWRSSDLFDAAQCAALEYADAMTLDIQVSDAVFQKLKPHFTERQIVELTVLIATYNMHNRVLEALKIDPTLSHHD